MSPATLTLTASDALARALRIQYNLEQQRAGRAVWSAPSVHSLRQWVQNQWLASWPGEQLLHSAQTLVLWETVIQRDGRDLLAPQSTAREAQRADQIARLHLIDCSRVPVWTEEQQAFVRWRLAFDQTLSRHQWLTAADLYPAVTRLIEQGRIATPQTIELVGFSETLIPTQATLLAALEQRGSSLHRRRPQTTEPRRWQFKDAQTQIIQIAWQIRERLTPAARDPDREVPRILVALPDVEARRTLVENLFRPILAPWLCFPDDTTRPVPWRFERGQPLAQTPVVHTALTALACEDRANPNERISQILLSSVLWSVEEREHTARLDRLLREQRLPQLNLWQVESRLSQLPEPIALRLGNFLHALRTLPRRALPSEYAAQWLTCLNVLGWPGAGLGSESYQAQRSFERALNQLAAMDLQLGSIGNAVGRRWLGEILRSLPFSPRTESVQPITILSLDEAPGTPCDAAFVLDLTDEQFPTHASATPFIALETQRQAGVIQASPEQQLATAQQQVHDLLGLCKDVTLCMPRVDERGADTAVSPLWGPVNSWQPGPLNTSTGFAMAGVRLEWPATDIVPPITDPSREGVRGGVDIFKSYAQAPFYAFARHRLGVTALPIPPRGLDALRQGNLIHDALHRFWKRCRDSQSLLALNEAALQTDIDAALAAVFDQYLPPRDFSKAQRQLEMARLRDLLRQWLIHEKRRSDPFHAVQLECEAQATVRGLPLKLRIDRIDEVQTPEGTRAWLLIDYKTGREASPSGWKANRLREPQLPLYATHATRDQLGIPQVDGIAFAHLRDGHPALAALARWRQKLIEPEVGKLVQDWHAQLAEWREQLDRMAQGFLDGDARLPADAPDHELRLLARLSRESDDEADGQDGENPAGVVS